MSNIILKAENISKQYRLGLVGTGTLSHDLNRWWHKVRGKEDPYLKIGAVNDRSAQATDEYVWALQDINFEVQRGEVLGIIGKNGAGKSTLLKILSRVTSPTTGVIKTRGRIASLLEVGTGFHPELTGRENIFLNGAILGMTKSEIRSKIDEIVDFSGCEMYIDTPVKRYSSGMRVRLGFAVAAHLEPDILVVDEVLAVGDAEFQKKAIGKMQDVSRGEGRTILFVSHNMAAVEDLCTSLIILSNGIVSYEGEVSEGINNYLSLSSKKEGQVIFEKNKDFYKSRFFKFTMLNKENEVSSVFKSGEDIIFVIDLELNTEIKNPIFSLRISSVNNVNIVTWRTNDFIQSPLKKNLNKNTTIKLTSNKLYLLDGIYSVSISFLDGKELLDFHIDFLQFEVMASKPTDDFYIITKSKSTNSLIYSMANWEVEYN